MCTPTAAAITLAVVAAASTAASQMSQAENAANQQEYQNNLAVAKAEAAEAATENAQKAAIEEMALENLRTTQEEAAASSDIQAAQIEALRRKGAAKAEAAGAGISGLSVDRLLADYDQQLSRYRANTLTNLDFSKQASGFRKEASIARAEGRAAGIPSVYRPKPIPRPSLLGSALKIGGSAASAYFSVPGTVPTE